MSLLAGELRKTVTLPAAWAGVAVAVLGCAAITVLNGLYTRSRLAAGEAESASFGSAFETAYAAMPLGTVGAIVIGVIAIGSEYTPNSDDAGGGRQIGATLSAMPRRLGLLAAKAGTVALLVLATAAVAVPVSTLVARVIIGDLSQGGIGLGEALLRSATAATYWTLMGLIALAITVLTRSGVVPLVVLIVNGSVVSVSLLLAKLTPLAYWLPDVAGQRLFSGLVMTDDGLAALPGGLVMAGWTALLLAVAAVAFDRRDA